MLFFFFCLDYTKKEQGVNPACAPSLTASGLTPRSFYRAGQTRQNEKANMLRPTLIIYLISLTLYTLHHQYDSISRNPSIISFFMFFFSLYGIGPVYFPVLFSTGCDK